MNIGTLRKTSTRPQKWTRKGVCLSCGVSTGSNHAKACTLEYTKTQPTNAKQNKEKQREYNRKYYILKLKEKRQRASKTHLSV
jgi:hypothetical protein